MIIKLIFIILIVLLLLFSVSFWVAYRHTEPAYPALYRAGFWEYGKAPSVYEWFIKRLIDIVLSFIALVVLSPALLIIMLLIYMDDPGRVFFTQERVGLGKKNFSLHKFRTMKLNTPHDVPTHMLEDPDQYITKLGRFLRRTSLDELPQIWDIFGGRMSIVGPRPALWNQYDLIEERDKYGANYVMPGLTGLAQISGRDELSIPVKSKLDGEYTFALKKSSLVGLRMDLKCFIGTILPVLRGKGVVEGKHE
ncbi:MAG: sugar transferase [Eubacterium sp.]|nr:sugar transferase [Eubacterium sp.]